MNVNNPAASLPFEYTKARLSAGGVAPLPVVERCAKAMEHALKCVGRLPGLVCLYGNSGYGKSVAADALVRSHNAYYVQARSVWNKKHALIQILNALNETNHARTIPAMLDQAAAILVVDDDDIAPLRPLVIDEADHLVDRGAIELIRDLYEASGGTPILMVGEEKLATKIEDYERVHSRVLEWVKAEPLTLIEAKQFADIYCPQLELPDDLLQALVFHTKGSARRLATNLGRITDFAATASDPRITIGRLRKAKFSVDVGKLKEVSL